MRSALPPILFAIVLIIAGLTAYTLAPPQANAATALIVPGVCAVIMLAIGVGVLVTGRKSVKTAGRIHLVGVILTLVFLAAFVSRAIPTMRATNAYEQASQDYRRQVEAGTIDSSESARTAFYEGKGVPDHSKFYLGATLFTLSAAAALTFVVMLATPPRKDKKLTASDVRTPPPAAKKEV
ncbi:MAG: hypothetical protein VYC34_09535 [Planctomycetota bacterium]|nr:hypothetical protein [Planctomycetota bacterium]